MFKCKAALVYMCVFVQQWFVHLPPILTFEFSRFQFNKNLARPEKIHNPFDFPVEIFMDRWVLIGLVDHICSIMYQYWYCFMFTQ